jgi:hypothetical protein
MMSMMKRVQETNAQEESAASRRRAGPQVNINVGDQSASQSRAVHCENPSAILERQRPRAAAEMQVPTEVHLADVKAHIRLLNANLAALKNQTSAEAPLVSNEAPPVSADAPLVSSEAPPMMTEAPLVFIKVPPVSREAPQFLQRHHRCLQRGLRCLQRHHRCLQMCHRCRQRRN